MPSFVGSFKMFDVWFYIGVFDYQQQRVKTKSCVTLARSLGKRVVRQRDLAYSFHTLPEFRNICAHDERLYCARVGKRADKGFPELLRAFEPVVERSMLVAYVGEVASLLDGVRSESPEIAEKLLQGMQVHECDFNRYLD